MTTEFDAYHKWLGIPPAEQPPNHYRLLGMSLFESDHDVIEAAADQRMAHVRTYQTGVHSARSQALLNEITAARLCLLDERRRKEYDEKLRGERPGRTADPLEDLAVTVDTQRRAPMATKAKSPGRKSQHWWFLAGAALLLALAGALTVAVRGTAKLPQSPNVGPVTKRTGEAKPNNKISEERPRSPGQPQAAQSPAIGSAILERSAPAASDPDRAAAEWVLTVGGKVTIGVAGQPRDVTAHADLPTDLFELWDVNLIARKEIDNAALGHLAALRHARTIDLSSTDIGDDGVRHFQDLTSLENLFLGGTQVSDSGLIALKNLTRLRSLGLNFTRVTGPGLAAITHLQELRFLDLSAMKLGDGGLVNLAKFHLLEVLALNFTDITDDRIPLLAPLTKLWNVALLRTSITDAGLKHLAAMRQLKYVGLNEAAVTDAGIKQLQEALPECQIAH